MYIILKFEFEKNDMRIHFNVPYNELHYISKYISFCFLGIQRVAKHYWNRRLANTIFFHVL